LDFFNFLKLLVFGKTTKVAQKNLHVLLMFGRQHFVFEQQGVIVVGTVESERVHTKMAKNGTE
jgi:hypothetical protein